MDRHLQGSYGYSRHKPDRVNRDLEDRRRPKEARISPSPHKEAKPARSQSPMSNRTHSHKDLPKPSDRILAPVLGEFKDTTLNNYFWNQDKVVEYTSEGLGKRPSLGAKVVAVVEENAEYYEGELKKELEFLEESVEETGKHSLSLVPRREEAGKPTGFFTPTYSLDPPVDIPRLKNDTLKKIIRKERIEYRPSLSKAFPSIRESKEVLPRTPSRRVYRLKALLPPSLPQPSPEAEESSKEHQLEESIQELDEMLLRLKKKQSLRSVSVMKDKSKKRRQERYLPRLKLPPV